jgi:hypothetical protein
VGFIREKGKVQLEKCSGVQFIAQVKAGISMDVSTGLGGFFSLDVDCRFSQVNCLGLQFMGEGKQS